MRVLNLNGSMKIPAMAGGWAFLLCAGVTTAPAQTTLQDFSDEAVIGSHAITIEDGVALTSLAGDAADHISPPRSLGMEFDTGGTDARGTTITFPVPGIGATAGESLSWYCRAPRGLRYTVSLVTEGMTLPPESFTHVDYDAFAAGTERGGDPAGSVVLGIPTVVAGEGPGGSQALAISHDTGGASATEGRISIWNSQNQVPATMKSIEFQTRLPAGHRFRFGIEEGTAWTWYLTPHVVQTEDNAWEVHRFDLNEMGLDLQAVADAGNTMGNMRFYLSGAENGGLEGESGTLHFGDVVFSTEQLDGGGGDETVTHRSIQFAQILHDQWQRNALNTAVLSPPLEEYVSIVGLEITIQGVVEGGLRGLTGTALFDSFILGQPSLAGSIPGDVQMLGLQKSYPAKSAD